MTTIRKSVITAGDIQHLLELGLIDDDTQLVVTTRFAPVPVESLTTGASQNFNSGRNVLYIEAPVEKYMESWGQGHHGGPLRGQSEMALSASIIADQIEDAHEEYGQE